MRWLRQKITRKGRGKPTSDVLLLQDNATTHKPQVAMTAATECGFIILLHPSYSPDMAPSDFYLLPKLISHLRGTQYGSNEGVIVIEAVSEYFGDQEKAFYFDPGATQPPCRGLWGTLHLGDDINCNTCPLWKYQE